MKLPTPLINQVLYHIVDSTTWIAQKDAQSYEASSRASEGFVHLSNREQILKTANAFFKGQKNLLLLELFIPDSDILLKWESVVNPKGVLEPFPHYYGKLAKEFIRQIYLLLPETDGTFFFPTQLYPS